MLCLMELRFQEATSMFREATFSFTLPDDEKSYSRNVASLNILVYEVLIVDFGQVNVSWVVLQAEIKNTFCLT